MQTYRPRTSHGTANPHVLSPSELRWEPNLQHFCQDNPHSLWPSFLNVLGMQTRSQELLCMLQHQMRERASEARCVRARGHHCHDLNEQRRGLDLSSSIWSCPKQKKTTFPQGQMGNSRISWKDLFSSMHSIEANPEFSKHPACTQVIIKLIQKYSYKCKEGNELVVSIGELVTLQNNQRDRSCLRKNRTKKVSLKNRETEELKTQEDTHALSHMPASIVFP